MPLIMGRISNSYVNGPGSRAVIHFQGCSLACAGCWNPNSHAFDTSKEIDIEDVKKWILEQKGVEGITFSGGEPMQQAQYLYLLTEFIKAERPDWTLIMFTGYSIKELERGAFKWHKESDGDWQAGSARLWDEIRKNLDLVVAGRYNQEKRTGDLPLRGSSNQELVFISDKISDKDLLPQEVEMSFDPETGLLQITGFPVGWEEYNMSDSVKVVDPKPKSIEDDGEEGLLVGV